MLPAVPNGLSSSLPSSVFLTSLPHLAHLSFKISSSSQVVSHFVCPRAGTLSAETLDVPVEGNELRSHVRLSLWDLMA